MLLVADSDNEETSDLMPVRQTLTEGQRQQPEQHGMCDEW